VKVLGVDVAMATCGYAVVDASARPLRVVEIGAIPTERDGAIRVAVDRSRRIGHVGGALAAICARHAVTTIAGEEPLGFGTVHAVIPQALCWGALSMLATLRDLELVQVVSKDWQEEVSPGLSKLKKANRYPVVEAKLVRYLGAQLDDIAETLRTHVIDAVAIALFAVLQRHRCQTVIRAARPLPVKRRTEGATP
jgi:Holliday junction resolvasome RuvABC endonuclease subunit